MRIFTTNNRNRDAFTLVEMLVVVVLIGLAVSAMGGSFVNSYRHALIERAARDIMLSARYARVKAVESRSDCMLMLDRENSKLYYYPSEEVQSIELSMLEKPLVSIKGASNVQFKGIIFECSRGMGVYMERTQNNLISDCTFKNLGIVGVCVGKGIYPFKELRHEGTGEAASEIIGSYLQHIYEDPVFNREAGRNNGVVNCTIYNTGAGGIHLSGGDRLTLEPGNNYVENCIIHDFNRIEKSYRAGIDISGVGNRISNCELYNAPSMAILMRGNDHLFEYNEIHHVCQEVHDQGALYYGRDPSERGHVVRYNLSAVDRQGQKMAVGEGFRGASQANAAAR